MPPKAPRSLASPTTSPVYAQGAVASVRPQKTIADYKKRFERNYAPPKPKKLPKVAPQVDTGKGVDNEYQDLMKQYRDNLAQQRNAAAQLFNKNKGSLEANRALTKESITKQRGSDLDDIAQNYAARGIGRSSGVYQQAGIDYETSVAERLKNADKTFDAQIKDEAAAQDASVGEATTAYSESLAEAAARKAAANAEAKAKEPKAKARPLPSPIAPKKKQPKFELGQAKGKIR